jgi:hypothetical protein
MSTDTKFNGWTNYATWRINLEIFDGFDPREHFSRYDRDEAYNLAHDLKEYALEVVIGSSVGLMADYASAFIDDVNFYEIAEHMITECNQDEDETC